MANPGKGEVTGILVVHIYRSARLRRGKFRQFRQDFPALRRAVIPGTVKMTFPVRGKA